MTESSLSTSQQKNYLNPRIRFCIASVGHLISDIFTFSKLFFTKFLVLHHHCLSQFVLNKVRAITGRGLTLTQVFHGGDSGSQVVGEAANRSSREEAATGRWRPQESGGGLAALDDSLENLATPVLRRA